MCDEYEFFEFTEIDAAQENYVKKQKRKRLRESSNPFDMDERSFVQRYRLTKDLVRNLCDELKPYLSSGSKSTDLSIETKVLVALSFYATGSYQRPTGDIVGHSVSQPAVSKIIKEITKVLNLPQIQGKYITFPRTLREKTSVVRRFYDRFGMPGVVGCIDCTHVAIVRPSEHEERFYCRKQYHSLNVQLVSNADMEIMSVDASYGGATHDCFIWECHPLKQHMEELGQSMWLLGDSGYPLRKYLMTPITNATPGTPEADYTALHVRTRNVIERTIGLLKARFRCLLVHRVLHYSPSVAASIVNACVVLHNICVRANLMAPELTDEESAQEAMMQSPDTTHQNSEQPSSTNRGLNEGLAVRRMLVSRISSRI